MSKGKINSLGFYWAARALHDYCLMDLLKVYIFFASCNIGSLLVVISFISFLLKFIFSYLTFDLLFFLLYFGLLQENYRPIFNKITKLKESTFFLKEI